MIIDDIISITGKDIIPAVVFGRSIIAGINTGNGVTAAYMGYGLPLSSLSQ